MQNNRPRDEVQGRAVDAWISGTERDAAQAATPAFERVAGAVVERRRSTRRRRTFRQGLLGVAAPLCAAAAVLFLVVSAGGEPAPADSGRARVVSSVGPVSLLQNGQWQTIDEKMTLGSGDRIETGSAASLGLERRDTARVRVAEKTQLVVQTWNSKTVSLRLERGELYSQVDHRAPDQRYEIYTPDAVVTVVGTRFVTRYQPGEGTTVEGQHGVVRVTDRNGQLLGNVRAGETLRTQVADLPAVTKAAPSLPVIERDEFGPSVATAKAMVEVEAPVSRPTPEKPSASVAPVQEPLPSATIDEAIAHKKRAPKRKPATVTRKPPLAPVKKTRSEWRAEGDQHALARRHRLAAEAYGKAIAAHPSDPASLAVEQGQSLQKAGQRAAAAALWKTYARDYPRGQAVVTVAARLARHHASKANWFDAEWYWRLVVEQGAGTPEGSRALVALGRRLLQQRQWQRAATLFEAYTATPGATGELAIVGLIKARAGQKRWAAVRALAAQYQLRYPRGRRQAEIDSLMNALPD
ncbi:MAG: hypothetical protein ACI9MR_002587 [Myxococcota bacterium]|jgi:hypothetical protein